MSCKWTSSTSRWADHLWSAFGRLSVSVNRRGASPSLPYALAQVLLHQLQRSPLFFSPQRRSSGQDGKDHRQDCGIAAKRKLLFSRVLPSQDADGGVSPHFLTFLKTRPVTNDDLNIVGLFQSTGSFRAHVTSTTSLVRYRHLGSRWKHGR